MAGVSTTCPRRENSRYVWLRPAWDFEVCLGACRNVPQFLFDQSGFAWRWDDSRRGEVLDGLERKGGVPFIMFTSLVGLLLLAIFIHFIYHY